MNMKKEEKENLLNNIKIINRLLNDKDRLTTLKTLEKIVNYIEAEIEAEKPKELYAILDTHEDKIIFNARGGCYHKKEDAERKIKKLIQEDSSKDKSKYKVVVYKLCETAL